jgi:hypothetical protein
VIFVDSPVNVGFSYSDDPRDRVFNEATVADDLLDFMQQFLKGGAPWRCRDGALGSVHGGVGVHAVGRGKPALGAMFSSSKMERACGRWSGPQECVRGGVTAALNS